MVTKREFILEVCTTPVQNIKALRQQGEAMDWSMTRHEGSRMVDRFAIIMPMVQSSRSLGLSFTDGPLAGLEMHTWQETTGSSGAVGKTAWTIPGGIENPEAKRLIRQWAAQLPRCPWKWTFGERSVVGFLLPVWRRSRRAFAKIGIDSWPIESTDSAPPDSDN